MARHANMNWTLPEGDRQPAGNRIHLWDSIQAAVLMDLRDELQRLNRVFACSNFTSILGLLREIAKQTQPTPFRCGRCRRAYATKASLASHRWRAHRKAAPCG